MERELLDNATSVKDNSTYKDELKKVLNNSAKLEGILEKSFNDKYILKSTIDSLNSELLSSLIETYIGENNIDIIDDTNYDILSTYNQYLANIKKYEVLTKEEETRLFTEYKNGNQKAKDLIINCNQRLVIKIAASYQARENDFLSLVQEGNIGLIIAVEHFDISKENKFSTYAIYWIKQKINYYLTDKSRSIRIPSNILCEYLRMEKIIANNLRDSSKNYTNEELASIMNTTIEKIEYLKSLPMQYKSLNITIGENQDTELGDLIEDDNASYEEDIINKFMHEDIINEMNKYLTDREIHVITKTFGLDGRDPVPLRDLGKEIGVSGEAVRQIRDKATRKLRVKGKHLKDYL